MSGLSLLLEAEIVLSCGLHSPTRKVLDAARYSSRKCLSSDRKDFDGRSLALEFHLAECLRRQAIPQFMVCGVIDECNPPVLSTYLSV